VPTEFQVRAGIPSDAFPRLLTRSPERVAADGYRALKEGRRIVVPGFVNKVVTVLMRMTPHNVLLKATDLHKRNRAH